MHNALGEVSEHTRFVFPLCLGVAYLLSCPLARERKLLAIYNVHWLVGITLVTFSVPSMLAHDWTIALWAGEVTLLTWVGLRYEIRPLRWFALALASIVGTGLLFTIWDQASSRLVLVDLPVGQILGLTGVIALAGAAALHRIPRFQQVQGDIERRTFSHLYFFISAFLSFLLVPAYLYRSIEGTQYFDSAVADSMVPILWALESALIASAGFLVRDRVVTRTGTIGLLIAAVTALLLSNSFWWSPCITIGILLIAAFLSRQCSDRLGPSESKLNFYALFIAASLLTLSYTLSRFNDDMLALRWTGEGLATVALGFLLKDRLVRVTGAFYFLCAGWALILSTAAWGWIPTGCVAAMSYIAGHLYRRAILRSEIGEEHNLSHWYELAATIVLTALIGIRVAAGWLSGAWCLEALALLIAGFMIPDKWFRVSGLVIFAMVVCKLLFIDLAAAATIQRILSFIGAGIVLLVSSYAYARFTKKLAGMHVEEQQNDALMKQQ
jgi:hypothetical protein